MLCSPPSFRSLRAIAGVAKHGAYKKSQHSWQHLLFSYVSTTRRTALVPYDFRFQVNRMAQKYLLRTSSDCVRDSAARSAAHLRSSYGSYDPASGLMPSRHRTNKFGSRRAIRPSQCIDSRSFRLNLLCFHLAHAASARLTWRRTSTHFDR